MPSDDDPRHAASWRAAARSSSNERQAVQRDDISSASASSTCSSRSSYGRPGRARPRSTREVRRRRQHPRASPVVDRVPVGVARLHVDGVADAVDEDDDGGRVEQSLGELAQLAGGGLGVRGAASASSAPRSRSISADRRGWRRTLRRPVDDDQQRSRRRRAPTTSAAPRAARTTIQAATSTTSVPIANADRDAASVRRRAGLAIRRW